MLFKHGDVVRLNGGGPHLTVDVTRKNGDLEVLYFDASGRICRAVLPPGLTHLASGAAQQPANRVLLDSDSDLDIELDPDATPEF